MQQIQARQKALSKLPSWANNPELIFPPSLSMEQSSSEATARFKAGLVSGTTLIDLSGGFGVDAYYLSRQFQQTIYCERQEELARIALHNFEVLAPGKIQTVNGDSIDYLLSCSQTFDLIYLDPARRGSHNQKLVRLADCEPDVVAHWEELKGKGAAVLIKASPMLDIKKALSELPDIQQIWVVAVKNEVKEVLLHWEAKAKGNPVQIHCLDLQSPHDSFSFTYEEEAEAVALSGEASTYLIEPNASILKAGAFKCFAKRFSLSKLHPNSHLYTRDEPGLHLPGRVFSIIQELSSPKKELKKLVPDGKINVITRNYAVKAEELKKKYRLHDGGDRFLIGTKVGDAYRLFYCRPSK